MKYYMAGIKGAGMSALALLLSDLGYEIVGYDDDKNHKYTEDKLIERGIKILNVPNNELDSDTVVIHSIALNEEHPELIKARDMGLRIYEYKDMLGKLSKKYKTICITGCHGKTSTASILTHIMSDVCGSNYIVGNGVGHGDKTTDKLILEASEYKRQFLTLEPEYIIITNIEMDHTDYYKNIDDMILAYQDFASKASKMVLACGDDSYTHMLNVKAGIFYYGLNDDNDIQARNVEYTSDGTNFDVFVEDEYFGHFELPIYGKHMLLNILSVIAICYYERIDLKELSKSLKKFEGIIGIFKEEKINNNIIISDYANHPTEIKYTIKAAKQKYPDKKIITIFEPYTYARVEKFKDEFINVLALSDKTYIMDINYDSENPEDFPDLSSYSIIKGIKSGEHINPDESDKLLKYKDTVMLFIGSKDINLLLNGYRKLQNNKE